jgi:putative nucleotidyltransferase with HDIG domain
MRVLRMVNSAMYQRRTEEKIGTVRRAVIVLGFETVRKLALGLSVFDMMSKLSRSPHLVEVSRHSLIAGAFAQKLAEASGRIAPEEALVIALVHDIGKVVLLECSPADYDRVLADVAEGRDLIDAERAHFGMSHDRAGRRLARKWKLPTDLQGIIGDHHDFDPLHPPRIMDSSLAVLVYADAMSRFECTPEKAAREIHILHKAGLVLGIPNSRADDLYAKMDRDIVSLARDLDMSVGDLRAYGILVNADGSVAVAPPLSREEIAERTARQLEIYQSVGRGIAAGRDRSELMQEVLDGLVQVLGFARVVLFRVDRLTGTLKPMMWRGPDVEESLAQLELPLEHSSGALALCAIQRRAFHVPAAQSEAYGDQAGRQLLEATQTQGFACAPVLGSENVAAVLFADHGPAGPDVLREQAAELEGLATQLGMVLQAAPVGV